MKENATRPAQPSDTRPALSAEEAGRLDAYWRAANYLSVGQIYLLDNPLLREPLRPEHVKPRLLGHWGTTPGLNFIYAHLNRVIKARDLSMMYVCGPGHGGPAMVASTYLEGTYSEIYPEVTQDADGMRRLFRQFSFPGGIPSHAAPETPGSIHEGGELGYALMHAFGAAFDNPDLIVACVVGDGEAETGPLAASWHSNKFLNPASDGAVLPILHLNGYKIANPTSHLKDTVDYLGHFADLPLVGRKLAGPDRPHQFGPNELLPGLNADEVNRSFGLGRLAMGTRLEHALAAVIRWCISGILFPELSTGHFVKPPQAELDLEYRRSLTFKFWLPVPRATVSYRAEGVLLEDLWFGGMPGVPSFSYIEQVLEPLGAYPCLVDERSFGLRSILHVAEAIGLEGIRAEFETSLARESAADLALEAADLALENASEHSDDGLDVSKTKP